MRHMNTEEYLSFLKEGINNYEYMVMKLKKSVSSEHVLCSYSFLIHMGDLSRYIYLEEPKNSESFASSQECYLKAIRCDPTQGNAYHQLAVLASYKRSYCQALYYCIRAITCPSPFSTAFSNIPYHFAENEKNLAKAQSMYPVLNKHHCNEVLFSRHFYQRFRNCFSSSSIVVATSTTLLHTHPLLLRSASSPPPWIGVWSRTSLLPQWWSACWPLLSSVRRIFGVASTKKVFLMRMSGLPWRSELLFPHITDSGRMVTASHSHDECDSLYSHSCATFEAVLLFCGWLKTRQTGIDPHCLGFSLPAVALFEKRAALPTSCIPRDLSFQNSSLSHRTILWWPSCPSLSSWSWKLRSGSSSACYEVVFRLSTWRIRRASLFSSMKQISLHFRHSQIAFRTHTQTPIFQTRTMRPMSPSNPTIKRWFSTKSIDASKTWNLICSLPSATFRPLLSLPSAFTSNLFESNIKIGIFIVVFHTVLARQEERHLRSFRLSLAQTRGELSDLLVLLLQFFLLNTISHSLSHQTHTARSY